MSWERHSAADVTDPDISTAFRTYSISGRKVWKSEGSCVKHGSCYRGTEELPPSIILPFIHDTT